MPGNEARAIIDASRDESKLRIYVPLNDKREISTSAVAEFPRRASTTGKFFSNFSEGYDRRGDRNAGGDFRNLFPVLFVLLPDVSSSAENGIIINGPFAESKHLIEIERIQGGGTVEANRILLPSPGGNIPWSEYPAAFFLPLPVCY